MKYKTPNILTILTKLSYHNYLFHYVIKRIDVDNLYKLLYKEKF